MGTDNGLNELLDEGISSIKSEKRKALQYYLSTDHAIEVFSTWFGPTLNALEKIGEDERDNLLRDCFFRLFHALEPGATIAVIR